MSRVREIARPAANSGTDIHIGLPPDLEDRVATNYAKMAIGYVMNKTGHELRSPRALALCHAVYDCLN